MSMTEYCMLETTVHRSYRHITKIEAKFIRGTAVNVRDTGTRLGSWVQHFCASHATTRESKEDRLCSIWSYTMLSRCARCLPLYLQDTVEACVSIVRF